MEKVDEKNEVISLVSIFPSWVMVLKLSKKCFFCNFVLSSARNLSLLKQFTYKYLKVLITIFQKMVRFIGVCGTIYKILALKISKRCWISRNLTKFFDFKPYNPSGNGYISDASPRRLIQRLRDISNRADLQISETSPWRLIKDVSSETSLRSLRFSQRRLWVASARLILGLQTKALFV